MPVSKDFQPLYMGGKRDKARRYVNQQTGEVISRRRYQQELEGVTFEKKAATRKEAGLTVVGGRGHKTTPEEALDETQRDTNALRGVRSQKTGFYAKRFRQDRLETGIDRAAGFILGPLQRRYGTEENPYEVWVVAHGIPVEGYLDSPLMEDEEFSNLLEKAMTPKLKASRTLGVYRTIMPLTAVSDVIQNDMEDMLAQLHKIFAVSDSIEVRWRSRTQARP